MTDNQEKSSLRKIPNVGSQTEQDLIAMGLYLYRITERKESRGFV